MAKNYELKDNMCEICGEQATEGILDDERYIQTRIRYACQDHIMQVHDRIVSEAKERRQRNDRKE